MMRRALGLPARGICIALLAILALPAHALQIDGLSPVAPIAVEHVTPVVAAGTLRIPLAPDQVLSVAPWPAYLPQRFGTVALAATRQPHPAGPIDHLSFSRQPGQPTWLELARGARPASSLVGSWQLQLSARGWEARQGRKSIRLAVGSAPATLTVGNARWCLYLLDAALPRTQAGLATEQEASAAWAALRLDARRKHCPAPPAAPR